MDLTASINLVSASLKYIAGISILLTIFALPEIIQKVKLAILKSKGYGIASYLAPTGDFREFIIKFKTGLTQLEPGLTIDIPEGVNRTRDKGIPKLFFSHKSALPFDFETGHPLSITPEKADSHLQIERMTTVAQLKQDDKKKEQLDQILKLATPALSGIALWFIMQMNDKLDKILSMAGAK